MEPSIYDGLRAQALNVRPADLGVKPSGGKAAVYGVVMDMGVPQGTATLVGFVSGDASLYLSTGGAMIGGGGHATVRTSAQDWVQVVQAHLAAFSPTTSFPTPTDEYVRFYVLTSDGVLTATVKIDAVDSGGLELSPVWYAGQRLLTDLRQSQGRPVD
ncbi:hypothetical protein [Phenylobacterium montanum]|uniref:Uncharacterized protein n=1 Tax=Phenylobacterium montanum TaxID=2823693 RepID=A0A975G2A3_9CAUL|nr:hypothetical protein [Caulobacter sp. S6]QUD88691.1 hypothetical protein KCG34_02035 [Caulobacter sp. S6]